MLFRIAVFLSLATLALGSGGNTPATSTKQMSTAERLQKPGWWPRKPTPARSDFTGPQACQPCHSAIFAAQRETAMSRTSATAAQSSGIRSFGLGKFTIGPFNYQLQKAGDGLSYTLSTGSQSITEPLGWAFGTEKIGQTYLFEKDGAMFESAFSYFEALRGFDRTPGLDILAPPKSVHESLREGAGRAMAKDTAEGCFHCHNTAAVTEGKLDSTHLIPSVTCEACHGPGAKHVAAENAEFAGAEALIFNPKRLSPPDSVDFCGSCHRTWWDVMLTEEVGVTTILAVPYRLEKSRCWGNGDARITCVGCHDPHVDLVRDAVSYDQRCLSCHLAKGATQPVADHPGAACPVATEKCVTCHMPKYEVPDMHYRFTDHMIRVVKEGAPFPD